MNISLLFFKPRTLEFQRRAMLQARSFIHFEPDLRFDFRIFS